MFNLFGTDFKIHVSLETVLFESQHVQQQFIGK